MKDLILAVDDDLNNLMLIEDALEDIPEIEVLKAGNVKEAREVMKKHADIKVILLDRMMPEIDGITYLKELKKNKRNKDIAIIMQTAASASHELEEGMTHGAYYYLTKPYPSEMLIAIVKASLHDVKQKLELKHKVSQQQMNVHFIQEASFEFKTLEQAHQLSAFLSQAYPNPEQTAIGIMELFTNAIEHGNLGINYEDKSELLLNGRWYEEVHRRLNLPEYSDKSVQVKYTNQNKSIDLLITDNGEGFDWNPYLKLSPNRAHHLHGRGIALSKAKCFDELEYLGVGNQVFARINTMKMNNPS